MLDFEADRLVIGERVLSRDLKLRIAGNAHIGIIGRNGAGKIGSLSGGQKAKILFWEMVLRGADVLVLDEPTRNFSPLSAPAVRNSLHHFGGAIISVSHDRKYLNEVCDQIYELCEDGLFPVENSPADA